MRSSQVGPAGRTSPESMVVAYILLRFPCLTETFVADEMRAVADLGALVRIVSLRRQRPGPVQPLSKRLKSEACYAPGALSLRTWWAQAHFLRSSPHLYLRLLLGLLRCPGATKVGFLKRMEIFLKSVAVAYGCRSAGISVFHSHFAGLPGMAAAVCGQLLGRPHTVTVHAYDLFVEQGLLGYVLGPAAHVVCISQYNAETIKRLRLCAEERISVIHCGVDLTQFPYNVPAGLGRRSGQDPVRILSVGSLIPKKGHKHLIAACGLLRDRGVPFACSIIGAGSEEKDLRRQIGSLGLESHIELLGARTRPEVVEEYAGHHIFVLPCVEAPGGDKDGIPVVLMEAGATGLPLISTPVSGIPELIHDNQTGLLAVPGDPRMLADAIMRLAENPELAEALSREARKRVEQEFNLQRTAASLLEVFFRARAEAEKTEGSRPCSDQSRCRGSEAVAGPREDFRQRVQRPFA